MLKLNQATPAVAVLAGAAAFGGCGGSSSSSVSPAAYVKSVCTAVGPFEKDIQSRSSALNLTNIANAQQGKTALEGFLTAASADTKKAVAQLRSAGSPDVSNGPKISSAIVGVFSKLDTALSQAATQATKLPTSSPTAFKNAAVTLGANVRSSMGSIGKGLTGLRNAQLEKAAAKEPACTTIGG